ncbi:hypothetical protein WA026_018946 [Henosepilachna vigintioctopunctata]|uniref:Acyl-CoA-binding domain-containing protein 6 n=1 Tax=Henosepilachna vigintioctopunctata TaxID=420089 RepID=A0AAW1UEQ7_9CUCU
MAEFVDNFSDLKELGVDCDVTELDQTFERAADHLPRLLSNLDDQILLTLYAYYKQGKEGVCNTAKPSWFDFKGRSKWEAWNKLKNMSQEEAKTLYVETIKKIDPNFECKSTKEKDSWVCVSTLQNTRDLVDDDKTIVDYVKEGNREKVQELLKTKTTDYINKLDENGMSLMHWASDMGSVDIISDLLGLGADINMQDSDGQTALHYSSSCGHLECVRFLLSRGALLNIEDNDGLSPVDVANDRNIKELLIF